MKKKFAPVRAIRVKGFAVACALVAENSCLFVSIRGSISSVLVRVVRVVRG